MVQEKTLGPADKEAFVNQLRDTVMKAVDDVRKMPHVTVEQAIKTVVDAVQTMTPPTKMGGLGEEDAQGLGDMENMAEDTSEGGQEE